MQHQFAPSRVDPLSACVITYYVTYIGIFSVSNFHSNYIFVLLRFSCRASAFLWCRIVRIHSLLNFNRTRDSRLNFIFFNFLLPEIHSQLAAISSQLLIPFENYCDCHDGLTRTAEKVHVKQASRKKWNHIQ